PRPVSPLFPYTTLFRSRGTRQRSRPLRSHPLRACCRGPGGGLDRPTQGEQPPGSSGELTWPGGLAVARALLGSDRTYLSEVRARSEEHTSELQSPDHLV